MRIAITTVQAPFLRGGAELLASGLLDALTEAGHEADIVTMPFRFDPPKQITRNMDMWESENLLDVSGPPADLVIALRFPAWYVQHSNKVVWMLHQHRSVYELWDKSCTEAERIALKADIAQRDTTHLGTVPQHKRFTISRNVVHRLKTFNGLDAEALYHPPPTANQLFCAEAQPYILFPSRLESLKRQDLLIEAMALTQTPIVALIAGGGGQQHRYAELIEASGLQNKVRLLGEVDQATLIALFAQCTGVFFGPFDEDYGYVTLEAMLAKKPVITCADSGGPLEFVVDGETGYVSQPNAQAVANAIDSLTSNPAKAKQMGETGFAHYHSLNISWAHVVAKLTA
jgi:glycosyltransferase involved in cell wall biosynthesis